MEKSELKDIVYRWRIRANLIFLIAALILAKPTPLSLLAGYGLVSLGLLLRGWACGHLRKDKALTTSGPYRYTRNPLYLANLIMGIGVVVLARSGWVIAIFLLNFLLFYPLAVSLEADRMRRLFSDSYREFSRNVPLFLPRITPNRSAPPVSFQWAVFKKNKEIRALLGSAVYLACLVLKILIF